MKGVYKGKKYKQCFQALALEEKEKTQAVFPSLGITWEGKGMLSFKPDSIGSDSGAEPRSWKGTFVIWEKKLVLSEVGVFLQTSQLSGDT